MSKLVNEAGWDRVARVVLGLVLAGVGFFTAIVPSPWNYVAGVFGLVFITTGAIGFCPLYTLFKFQTLKK